MVMIQDEALVVENKRKEAIEMEHKEEMVSIVQRKHNCKCSNTLIVNVFKTQERNTLMFMTWFHLEKTKNWKRKKF